VVVVVVVVVVFAEAPFRHARFPFLLFAPAFVAIRFDEEEEHVEEDDDLIGIFDPVTSAILYSLISLSLFTLFSRENAASSLERTNGDKTQRRKGISSSSSSSQSHCCNSSSSKE
jgi:hypothetical protein